jgi:very-short-patch-repair endonuclease
MVTVGETSRLTVRRWTRYGHDRLYITAPDGSRAGWVDLKSGAVTVEQPALADAVERAVADFRSDTAVVLPTEPPVERHDRRPAPPTKQRITRLDNPRSAARREGRRRSFAERSWREPTLGEKALADELTRQSPFVWAREFRIDPYRLDFFCEAARLAVEVDGSSHRGRREQDATRDAFMRSIGIETLRVDARDVEKDCGAVVARINRLCIERTGTLPATDRPAPTLLGRLLGRREVVARPQLTPPQFARPLRQRPFVCARCRCERPGGDRSPTMTNCCTARVP